MMHGRQRDAPVAAVPIDSWMATAKTRRGGADQHYMISNLSKFVRISHFEQDFLSIDRTATVKAAVANDDAVCCGDPPLESLDRTRGIRCIAIDLKADGTQ